MDVAGPPGRARHPNRGTGTLDGPQRDRPWRLPRGAVAPSQPQVQNGRHGEARRPRRRSVVGRSVPTGGLRQPRPGTPHEQRVRPRRPALDRPAPETRHRASWGLATSSTAAGGTGLRWESETHAGDHDARAKGCGPRVGPRGGLDGASTGRATERGRASRRRPRMVRSAARG